MIATLLFIQAVVFAVLSAIVASDKNRSAAGWSILGFLFGLFGFIAAIVVSEGEEETQPDREKQSSSKEGHLPSTAREFDPDEHDKKCPDCAEYIKLEARVCKHCGHEFSDEEVEQQIENVKEEEVISYSGEPPKVENPKQMRDKL